MSSNKLKSFAILLLPFGASEIGAWAEISPCNIASFIIWLFKIFYSDWLTSGP